MNTDVIEGNKNPIRVKHMAMTETEFWTLWNLAIHNGEVLLIIMLLIIFKYGINSSTNNRTMSYEDRISI